MLSKNCLCWLQTKYSIQQRKLSSCLLQPKSRIFLFLSLNVVLLYGEHLASHFFYIQRGKREGSSCLSKKKYRMLRPILFSLVKRVIQKNVFVCFINGLCLRLENKVLKGVNYLVSNFMNSTTVSCFCGKLRWL